MWHLLSLNLIFMFLSEGISMKFNKRRDIRDVFNLLDILANINSTASVKSSVQPGRFITVDRNKTFVLLS